MLVGLIDGTERVGGPPNLILWHKAAPAVILGVPAGWCAAVFYLFFLVIVGTGPAR